MSDRTKHPISVNPAEPAKISFRLGHSDIALEDSPCATFLVKKDADFTILCGNTKFYDLLGMTPEKLRTRYGNRLAALLDAESLKGLPELALRQAAGDSAFLYLTQHMHRRSGEDKWFNTSAACVEYGEESVYCCFSFDVTRSVNERRKLESRETILEFVAERVKAEVFVYDTATGTAQVYASHAALRALFPESGGTYIGFVDTLMAQNIVAPDSRALFLEMFENLHHREERTACEIRLRVGENDYRWVLFSLEHHALYGANKRYAIGTMEDITQQKEIMLGFLRETQFFQAMLSETVAYGQLDVTEDRLLQCGGIWNLYNEVIAEVSYTELCTEFTSKAVHPEDRKLYLELMQRENFLFSLRNGIDRLGGEFRRIVEQNKMAWVSMNVHLFRDSATGHVMALLYLKNIDAEKKRQLSLLLDHERDHLTNIYSRRMAELAIRSYLEGVRADEICVLMMLDIDNFRVVNDTYGHRSGDDVLVTLARSLSQTFRKNDIIGRFGGDEFILFIKNISSMDRIRNRLDSLYAELRQERSPAFSVSIGVAPIVGGATYEQLFQRADTALFAAKQAGKACYIFFDGQHMTAPNSRDTTPVETPSEQLLPSIATTESASGAIAPFDAYIAGNGDIAYLVDVENYNLVCGNSAFYDRVGHTPAQCLGVKCYEIIQGRKTPCPFCSRANWSSDKFYLWRNANQFLEQEFLIKNKLVQWDGREVLLAIAVDISNNKSILDTLGTDISDSRIILGGIQQMAQAETLSEAMVGALEVVGMFFRADSAQLWERVSPAEPYCCTFEWSSSPQALGRRSGGKAPSAVDAWLRDRNWNSPLLIESQDAMLSLSYDMYQMMKKNGIQNLLWMPLASVKHEVGCIMVQNVTANFRSMTFIESFSGFIISEHKRRDMLEDILYIGTHDRLTGLLNRNSYDQFIHSCDGDDLHSLGVVFADFDSLRGINANRGYQIGDSLLTLFADMLRVAFTGADIFRLNGDEFVVVEKDVARADLDEQVDRLYHSVRKNGQFTISAGHCWDNVEKNLTVMVENAMQVMRINKKRHYDAKRDAENTVRSKMLQELMLSLERREYEIFLQPKVDLELHSLVGAEALVRYRDKERGIIPPGQFIDAMERNDFIRYVDLFVFEEVCRLLQRWTDNGWELPTVSLNFSRLTLLETDLVSSVDAIFQQYNVPKERIEIEVTESFADMGKGVLSQAVGGLYRSGFSISLDDFGTKYTNLSLLSDFDFNVLKLDKSLISAISNEDRNQIILRSIIEMCHSLGIGVIAEGVETQRQEDILRNLGCRLGQGYLYGKPMEVAEFERLYMTLPTKV